MAGRVTAVTDIPTLGVMPVTAAGVRTECAPSGEARSVSGRYDATNGARGLRGPAVTDRGCDVEHAAPG